MRRKRDIRLALTVFVIVNLALVLPSMGIAGSLEPNDPPGPTMKTLDEIYSKPIWNMYDQVFVDWSANPRFAVNDNGTPSDVTDDTVLDKETGLVWERNPDSTSRNWNDAHYTCIDQKYYSGHKGLRLPTIQELASLVDMRVTDRPKLPSGHPFTNVTIYECYWSATTSARDASDAWLLCFDIGRMYIGYDKVYDYRVWCVRGGSGVDPQ
jgi:hypothetical protein